MVQSIRSSGTSFSPYDAMEILENSGEILVEDSLIVSMFFTACVVGVSLLGLVLVRRWILAEDLKVQHVVADPLSQVVGMMFAVLLGFMVGDAMQRYAQTRSIVQQEAASLSDV